MLHTLHENMCIVFVGMFDSNLYKGSVTTTSAASFCRLVGGRLIPEALMVLIRTHLVTMVRDKES